MTVVHNRSDFGSYRPTSKYISAEVGQAQTECYRHIRVHCVICEAAGAGGTAQPCSMGTEHCRQVATPFVFISSLCQTALLIQMYFFLL